MDLPAAAESGELGLRGALKMAASALKAEGIRFALGGGYALWVHGAPEPTHDVDLLVCEPDVERAATCLEAAGLRVVRPPEDWLFKAYLDSPGVAEPALVDVLHRVRGDAVGEADLDAALEHEVLGLRLPVLPATAILITKLQSLSEHYCDFAPLLTIARAVREQLDWERVRKETDGLPFAEAFLLLTERLGIASCC